MQRQKDKDQIINISFNQDQTYFAIATQKGFRIYKLDHQLQLVIIKDFGSGIGIIQMIHKTNIFALVGGGKTPRYPKNKLMIWDDSQSKCIVQTSCKSEVKAVKINPQKCIIVLQTKIFVFNLADFRILETLQTCPNPKGLCSISALKQHLILAYPTKKIGTIEVCLGQERKKIQAHKSTIYALQLCPNGFKVATASQKGTIIRIFDIKNGQCIQQLRRGSQHVTIYSIAFNLNSQWLACSSDSGTVHIFAIKKASGQQGEAQTKNKKSKLSIFSKISPYFNSQWSFANYHTSEKKTKVGFLGKQNYIVIISTSGKVQMVKFDLQKGGDCTKQEQYNLFQVK